MSVKSEMTSDLEETLKEMGFKPKREDVPLWMNHFVRKEGKFEITLAPKFSEKEDRRYLTFDWIIGLVNEEGTLGSLYSFVWYGDIPLRDAIKRGFQKKMDELNKEISKIEADKVTLKGKFDELWNEIAFYERAI